MVSIFSSKEEITPYAANIFVAAAQNAIQKRGRFLVALTGGSSPISIYKLLATPQYKTKIDWENVFVFWGDERWVPLDDERSNAKMSSDYLLNHVGIPKSNLFPMYKQGDPNQARCISAHRRFRDRSCRLQRIVRRSAPTSRRANRPDRGSACR